MRFTLPKADARGNGAREMPAPKALDFISFTPTYGPEASYAGWVSAANHNDPPNGQPEG